MDIEFEYSKKLKELQKEYNKKHPHIAFRASSAGSCILKQIFYINKVEEKRELKPQELVTLRFGTIIHEDIQKLLSDKEDLVFEFPITIPELNVTGHIDALEIDTGSDEIIIYDFKTIKSYAFKRKFGLKKNRDPNPSEKYEMQIATYALAIKRLFPNRNIKAFIVYIRKDDARFNVVEVDSNIYMQKAYDYWETINNFYERNKNKIELKRGMMYCPVESWECKYCPYNYICEKEEEKNEKKV